MNKDKEQIKWVSAKYPADIHYASLEDLITTLQEALIAQSLGEWRNLSLETEEDYGSYSICLTGQRPETEDERTKREEWAKQLEENRRQTYEQLKKEFGDK